MWPENLGGYERHRKREGGDVGHADPSRSKLNKRLLGEKTWAQDVYNEIQEIRLENHVRKLEQLKKRRRTAEITRCIAEGPADPWRATRHGSLREVIITANRRWFDDDMTAFLGESGPTREEKFEALAVSWLQKEFGKDCVHARADRDEEAYHIHAVILPRATTKDGRRMLQPSVHGAIRYYEKEQDSIGAWFEAARIGLHRGERRKRKIVEAIEHNAKVRAAQIQEGKDEAVDGFVEVPQHRWHVSPRKWREQQDQALAERDVDVTAREADVSVRGISLDVREEALEDREAKAARKIAEADRKTAEADLRTTEADAVLDVAQGVAEGRIDTATIPETAGPETPMDAPDDKATPPERTSLAIRLFGRALAAIREKARVEAREEAREEFSSAFAEIKAADEAIVSVARLLPETARRSVAKARRSLSKRIMGLSKTAADWLDRGQEEQSDE
jgi:hypothetical protein